MPADQRSNPCELLSPRPGNEVERPINVLHPFKHFLELIHGKPDYCRSSVGASVRHAAFKKINKQRFHFLLIETPMYLDRRVAGHNAQDLIAKRLYLSTLPMNIHFIKDIEQQALVIRTDKKVRNGLDHECTVSEIINDESEFVQFQQVLR